jgi:hypothetical protein
MGQANRPQNYDSSLDRLTPDWKNGMPNPGLNATRNFGGASKDVLKESRGVMPKIKGTSATHGDMTGRSARTVQGIMKGFKGAATDGSQVSNTGPTPTTIHSKVSSRNVADSAASRIFHGNPSQKGL